MTFLRSGNLSVSTSRVSSWKKKQKQKAVHIKKNNPHVQISITLIKFKDVQCISVSSKIGTTEKAFLWLLWKGPFEENKILSAVWDKCLIKKISGTGNILIYYIKLGNQKFNLKSVKSPLNTCFVAANTVDITRKLHSKVFSRVWNYNVKKATATPEGISPTPPATVHYGF